MHIIVLASNNQHKLQEIQAISAGFSYKIISQIECSVPEVAETGLTFVENAILKARQACSYTKLPAIADDSGIEIDALHGEPGIYSARYAGKNGSDQDNIDKVLQNLHDTPVQQRQARYQCVMVYMRYANDPVPLITQGTWEGNILFDRCGANGFGYDPIFFVPTHNCSAAELPPDIKNHLSHRNQALQKLINQLKNLY